MELSVFSPALADKSLEEALAYLASLGVHSLELGCGGFPGTTHADAAILCHDEKKIQELKLLLSKYDFTVCALSTHGNPVHPNQAVAAQAKADFENACLLAQKLGVETVITFSGCPGDSTASAHPNWVTCPWPEDFLQVLDYQWNQVLVPYWKEAADFAKKAGVKRIALEMHPGFCVYNPETLLRLRAEVGELIGANFDPSHLIWQGIEPEAAIKVLGEAIYHFHAKDTKIDPYNTAVNGVLDTKRYTDELHRSWIFRTVGYGLTTEAWKGIMSVLNLIGYPYAVSIEHEDSLMSPGEGLEKAVAFMQSIILSEKKPGSIHWA